MSQVPIQQVPNMSTDCSPASSPSACLKTAPKPLNTDQEKTTPQDNVEANVTGRSSVCLDCLSSSPAQLLTVNRSYSSQSGVDIDLSQMSPSVCGEIISQCLSGGGGGGGSGSRSRSNNILNLSNSRVSQQQVVAAGRKRDGRKPVKRLNPRTPVVTRTRGKRFRSKSVSSDDEEHCHVTVTMKTMDVKRSVRRSKAKSATPKREFLNHGFRKPSKLVTTTHGGDENAFLCSPVYTISNNTRPGSQVTITQHVSN